MAEIKILTLNVQGIGQLPKRTDIIWNRCNLMSNQPICDFPKIK